ncbi:hypothetical protein [Streptacidiphilus sp. MAP5-3]|uniref:hypothetical protein n=1 Tax=unclassified Streptacidiphilus TaxID=2643834 RepID=UPI003511677E
MRREVEDFVSAGPIPSEDASDEEIDRCGEQLKRITPPVSDDEAQALATAFGPDDCFGLAWTLLHLIETAPGAATADYQRDPDNYWVKRLNARVENTRGTRDTG